MDFGRQLILYNNNSDILYVITFYISYKLSISENTKKYRLSQNNEKW